MILLRLAATAILAAITAPAIAQVPASGGTPAFQPIAPPPIVAPLSVNTSRGGGLVTGASGTPQSVMIPGSPVPGMMLNNGNGTSTIMIPGGASETVPNPR